MRARVFIVIFVSSTAALAQRSEELRGGNAPDGRFRVTVSQTARDCISYEIRRGSAVLHRVISSYRPETDDAMWAWGQAASADVYWSPEGRYVAIDEAPWKHGGRVFLVEVRRDGHVSSIRLPEAAIVATTKLKWDRYRIRVENGWTSDHDLSLTLGGYAIERFLPDGRYVSYNHTFAIFVHIDQHHAYVSNSRETTQTAK